MPVRLKDTQKAEKIFGNWPEAIIWSCLQNIMGAIYVDNWENPQSAMAVLGDFCYLAGRPDKTMVIFKPEWCKQDCMILIPQNEKWSDLIMDSYGGRAKKVMRYAIKKEKNVFDMDQLQAVVNSLNPDYIIKMIDKDCFGLCRLSEWSRDLVSQFKDYETFRKLGIGVVAIKDGELVSGASSYARYRDGIEIEIDTKEDYRRKGLAYACGAKLIMECLVHGLFPSWDAHNRGSVSLSGKLGYHFDHEYPAYEIWGN